MRKKKDEALKANTTLLSLPKSYHGYLRANGGVSKAVQELVTAAVTGITLGQMESMYRPEYGGLDHRERRDAWHREYLRLGRWMLEGQALAFRIDEDTDDVLVLVNWSLSSTVTWVRIRNTLPGFTKVCYDAVETSQPLPNEATLAMWGVMGIGGTSLDIRNRTDALKKVEAAMPPLKYRVMMYWLLNCYATAKDEQGETISNPDVTEALYMLPRPAKEG